MLNWGWGGARIGGMTWKVKGRDDWLRYRRWRFFFPPFSPLSFFPRAPILLFFFLLIAYPPLCFPFVISHIRCFFFFLVSVFLSFFPSFLTSFLICFYFSPPFPACFSLFSYFTIFSSLISFLPTLFFLPSFLSVFFASCSCYWKMFDFFPLIELALRKEMFVYLFHLFVREEEVSNV